MLGVEFAGDLPVMGNFSAALAGCHPLLSSIEPQRAGQTGRLAKTTAKRDLAVHANRATSSAFAELHDPFGTLAKSNNEN